MRLLLIAGVWARLTRGLIFNHLVKLVLVFQVDELRTIQEESVDVVARFGWSLSEVQNVVFPLEFKGFFRGYLALHRVQIRLVTNEEYLHIGWARVLDLFQPVDQAFERVSAAHRVSKNCGMGSSVEDLSDTAERFLSSCVPDLQLQYLILDANQVWTELDPHCDIMVFLEFILDQALQYTWFSDA